MFSFAFNLLVLLSVMYLFSSGRDYMKLAAKASYRPFWLDKFLMGWFAVYSFYLLFYPDECSIRYQLFNLPIAIHLLQLCVHSYTFNKNQ